MESLTTAAGIPAKESVEKQDTRETSELKRNFPVFAQAAAVFAAFYTFCLYKNPSGITYPLYVAGMLAYFRFCFRKLGITQKRGNRFCEICLLLLGISVFLTDSSVLNNITKKGVFLLLLVYLLHTVYDDQRWDFVQYTAAAIQTFVSVIKNIPAPLLHAGAYSRECPSDARRTDILKNTFIGLALSVPVLVILVFLLSFADAVFESFIGRFFEMLKIWDLLLIFFMAVQGFFFAYCLLAALSQRTAKENCPDRRCLESIPAVIVTGLCAAVYLLFCSIQIVCLFAGRGQLPDGWTYANYARRGFFELLTVCLINLGTVAGCTAFFKENRLLKWLLTVICACTYVMLASSAWRMFLYIDSYGLTFLRVAVLWALAVIAILMAGVTTRLFRKSFPLFRFGTAVVAVCYIGLALSHPDYYIAKYNLARCFSEQSEEQNFSGGANIDSFYLAELSCDAAPVLLNPDTYRLMKSRFSSAEMECVEFYRSRTENSGSFHLRSFNLSRFIGGLFIQQLKNHSL